ncbi:helix-turn-helix transcriptional regulator [Thermodesulfovibrio hydrogeniphilus]
MKILVDLKCVLLKDLLSASLSKEIDCDIISQNENSVPEIVVTDIYKIRSVKEKYPNLKIVILELGNQKKEILSAIINHNIKGVISSNSDFNLFKKALKMICDGELWLSREYIGCLMNNIFRKKSSFDIHFTAREKQIIDMICKGSSNREIANSLFIAEQTVKTHINNIFKKLNIKKRYDLIKICDDIEH